VNLYLINDSLCLYFLYNFSLLIQSNCFFSYNRYLDTRFNNPINKHISNNGYLNCFLRFYWHRYIIYNSSRDGTIDKDWHFLSYIDYLYPWLINDHCLLLMYRNSFFVSSAFIDWIIDYYWHLYISCWGTE